MYLFCNKTRKKLTMAHKGSSSFDWDSVEKEGSAWNWKVLQQDKQDPIYKMKIISFRCCIFFFAAAKFRAILALGKLFF